MKRATETRFGRLAVLAVALTALTACDEALTSGEAPTEATDEALDGDTPKEIFPTAGGKQRDVEAPEVFQTTEAGLWDGRPSLGGIWVAHPDVNEPERVLIKNTANNKSITGALFRRERNLPGPLLQVSSSAAAQLGMLAGSPTRLQVVALRREEVEPTPPPAPVEKEEEKPADDSDATVTAEAETEAAEKPAKRKWWQKKEPDNNAVAVAAGAATAGAAAAASSSDDVAEAAEAAVEAAPSTSALSDPQVTPPAEQPAKRKWWQKKTTDEITETPLDPIAGAAAAIEASEATPAETQVASAAATSPLTKPYVQIGTFEVQDNANVAAEKIRKNGMSAAVSEVKSGEKTVWRVLVGPAMTRAERKAILSDAKDLGFTDAFTAKN